MNLAFTKTRSTIGIQAQPVSVEVHLSNGLPKFPPKKWSVASDYCVVHCVTAESVSIGMMHRPAGSKGYLPGAIAVWVKHCSKFGETARGLMAGASISARIFGTQPLLHQGSMPIFIRLGSVQQMKSCLGIILHQAYLRNGWQRSGLKLRTVR